MPLLKTIKPEDAAGSVKNGYDYFMNLAGMVPLHLELLSVSPDLLSNSIDMVKYYIDESNLSAALLAHIRLLVANEEGYTYCVILNKGLLTDMFGMTRLEVETAMVDASQAHLASKDVEMLKFVIGAIKDPATTQKSDIVRLHHCGWTDRDIFEAYHEGLQMVIRGMAFKAFRMGE